MKEIMRRRSGLEKRGETEKCAARGGGLRSEHRERQGERWGQVYKLVRERGKQRKQQVMKERFVSILAGYPR